MPIDDAVDTEDPRPREYPCVASGTDPGDANTAYLYLAGGLSDDGQGTAVVRDDIEFLTVDLVSEHDQDDLGWTGSALSLSDDCSGCGARWQCRGWTGTEDLHSLIGDITPGTTWLWFGSGYLDESHTAFSDGTFAAAISVGGELTDELFVKEMDTTAGYGVASANNRLYVFSGASTTGATPSQFSKSGAICGDQDSQSQHHCSPADSNTPPELKNWNGDTAPAVGRYLAGSAQESSVIFLVGGTTATEAASDDVEWTNF